MISLRPYQTEAIRSAYRYFRENPDGSPLIVLPTGTGKSLVIAGLCHDLLTNYEGMRLVILSHSIELVEQDYNKLKEYWTRSPAGIYSASLGRKQAQHPVTFATIQSVFKKPHVLGHRDAIVIDEAHLLSRKTDGMYNQLIAGLKEVNPRCRLLGLTASPFRVDSGMLTEGDDAMFDDVCYEAKLMDMVNSRFLSPVISKSSLLQADLTSVKITAGEFNAADMEAAFEKDGFTEAVLDEALPLLDGRRAVMWFCTGIDHATHVRDSLRARGESAETVSSKTPREERRRILEGFKRGEFRHIVSMALITTGYDAPRTDGIVMLRATMSPGLFLQIAGRGLRLHAEKENCLFLDYGSNVTRHGALTHITPPARSRGRKGKLAEEKPRVRICELCRTAAPLDTFECPECGNPLLKERDPIDPTEKLDARASDAPLMMTDDQFYAASTFWTEVDRVRYFRHQKPGKPDSLRVEYECGMMTYKEWVCLFHSGLAQRKAAAWWGRRSPGDIAIPDTIDEVLKLIYCLDTPARVRILKKDNRFEVIDHEFHQPLSEARHERSPEAAA